MYRIIGAIVLFSILAIFPPAYSVLALDASSTSFFVRQDIAEIAGKSTSTSFWLFQNGSQAALGLSTSTSFQTVSGIIRALFQPVAPIYTLIHYHWRNDDGGEATSTSATGGFQDTILSSIAQNTLKRLRVEITNAGGTIKSFLNQQFRLEQGLLNTACSATSWVDVSSATGTWSMATTSNLTDGSDTTNIAVSTGGVIDTNHTFITPNGGVKTTSSQTGNISVPSDSFVELEYAVKPLASSTVNGTYCFRVTNAGLPPTQFVYSQYPQATVVVGSQSITLTIDPSVVNLPSLVPGSAVTATSTATVTISGGTNGYNLKLSRVSATSTLASSTLAFPDFTQWNPGSGCSSVQGNGTTTPGQVFSFRVRQSGTDSNYCTYWWGNNDNNGTALFAGTPTSDQTVVNATSSNNGTTVTYLLYRADAPPNQEATSYAGNLTITALANP